MNAEILSDNSKSEIKMQYAEVRLNQTNKRIDVFYDYLIPNELDGRIRPGVRVVVPFGKGNRELEGFVFAVKNQSSFLENLREISGIIDEGPVLTPAQIDLCHWMQRYYCSLFYEALTPFVSPVRVIKKRSSDKQKDAVLCFEAYAPKRKTGKRASLTGSCFKSDAQTAHVDFDEKTSEICELLLKDEHCAFFQRADIKKRYEIYLCIAEIIMASGRQAVILFPDVFSAKVFFEKAQSHFENGIAFCSGDLKPSARYDVYKGVQSGKIRVVVGTRVALFLPFSELSVVMMDEPDDSAYFARSMPRYDTFEVAKYYCDLCQAKLIMGGSELPLKIYHGIRQAKITLFSEEKRSLPFFEIVDMLSELRRGNPDFISNTLKQKMEETIENHHQKVLLMLNRRGYAGYLLCRNCGYVEKCHDCGISMRPYHDGLLHCTYCGQTKEIPERCPACGSFRFKPVGLGVEKAAEILRLRYPFWRIIQIDARNFADEEAYTAVKDQIEAGDWDIVIGTKVITRNLPYENVGLTAALLMDEAFNHGDYNDAEKACLLYRRFFHLSQRFSVGQTYDPDNEIFFGLQKEDPEPFLESEYQYRRLMHYPPACHLVIISLTDKDPGQVKKDGLTLFQTMKALSSNFSSDVFFQIYSPVLVGLQPKTGNIRYKMMIKTSRIDCFHHMMEEMIRLGEIEKLRSRVSIEIDPGETA